uniref:RxLR effector candidate protein n=1 Tax=Hyaloperonospora arabidopsidis (strain Emoy2) TaxID=559515 RepID=M4B6C6_HYAAE
MDPEYVAASEVGRKLLGVRETLSEIGESPALPMKVLIDNQAAIRQIEGEASSTKAEHIDGRVKYLCDYSR